MAALISAVAADLTRITATFDVAMDPLSLLPHLWSLYPTPPSADGAIIKATVNPGGLVVDLVMSPKMSANGLYDISADFAKTAAGAALGPNDKSASFQVPNNAPNPVQAGFPQRLRQTFLDAVAEETQYLAGRPTTLLVADFPSDAPVVLVESTLGFPKTGAFWIGDQRYRYTGRTPASFKGVTSEYPTAGQTHNPKALVFLDLNSVGVTP